MTDIVMSEIQRAQRMHVAGDRAGARALLEQLWETTGDALHRCTIAHYVADLQDSPAGELRWDERALEAVAGVTDERARAYDPAWRARSLLPSLHLSLADDYRRAGRADEARHHLEGARASLDELPEGDYGVLIRDAFGKISEAVTSGSTAPLGPGS